VLFRVNGDATDALINVNTTDVRCQTPVSTTCGSANAVAGADYTGELRATETLRITDRLNGPGSTQGTVTDTSFPVTVPVYARRSGRRFARGYGHDPLLLRPRSGLAFRAGPLPFCPHTA
jgi:hypothetical protein